MVLFVTFCSALKLRENFQDTGPKWCHQITECKSRKGPLPNFSEILTQLLEQESRRHPSFFIL